MSQARANVPEELRDFTRSDWEWVIHEAALGKENTQIATMYLLDAIPQVEIGAALNMERSTVSKRLSKMLPKIERTARRLKVI